MKRRNIIGLLLIILTTFSLIAMDMESIEDCELAQTLTEPPALLNYPESLLQREIKKEEEPENEKTLVKTFTDVALDQAVTALRKKRHAPKFSSHFCQLCDKSFYSKIELLNHHARNHQTEKPYECTNLDCLKCYSTKASFRLHTTRVHGDKRFICNATAYCKSSYAVRGDLNQHLKRAHKIKNIRNPRHTKLDFFNVPSIKS